MVVVFRFFVVSTRPVGQGSCMLSHMLLQTLRCSWLCVRGSMRDYAVFRFTGMLACTGSSCMLVSEGDLSRYTLIPWALTYSQSAWFAIGCMVLHMVINLDISTGGWCYVHAWAIDRPCPHCTVTGSPNVFASRRCYRYVGVVFDLERVIHRTMGNIYQ